MMAGPGKNNAVSLQSGIGRIRAGAIAVGNHVIAIDNIGTIRIVRGRRSWWLFLLGALVIGGAATQLNAYGAIAIAGIGFGIALVLGNLAQRVEGGLSIGTSDGCSTLIVSRDQAFLQRMLKLLVDRIDTGDPTLIADFDIARGVMTAASTSASATSRHDILMDIPPDVVQHTFETAPQADDSDDALFADLEPASTEPAEPPAALPEDDQQHPDTLASVQPERRQSFDRLLDGGVKPASKDDDWLARQGPAPAAGGVESEGGAARVLLALLIVVVIGAGVFAAWYFTGETGPASSISTIEVPVEEKAESSVAPPEPSIQPADDQQLRLDASISEELAPAIDPEPELELQAQPEPAPEPRSEVEDFTPPAPLVARTSGQRFRALPSQADDVAVLAETRAGGEALNITGRLEQPDGDWYRVQLPDNRTAWFKASLAVPRARFAETVGMAPPRPEASFAASAPQILEPSEGVMFGDGPQPVRLAWAHRDEASIYIVEIELYDAQTRRWIEDPLHKRATVEGDTELAEVFPTTGNWRWRVRGVTADGQQSQFSRWSAFGIRN